MATIETRARPCPACNSESARRFAAAGTFEIVACSACRTLFTAQLPASQADAHDYSTYYHAGNLAIPAFIERRLEEIVAEFDRYRRDGTWLDIGCGAGALMQAAARRGWTPIGTEVAASAAEAVRAEGFEVHVGFVEEMGLDAGRLDVVSMVEVIEHVEDPAALLMEAARLVRPGGAVYVTTPHGRGISARLLRARWSSVAPPEHLQLFSARGLEILLARSGLALDRLDTHGLNPHELRDVLFRRPQVGGLARVEDAYELNEALSTSRSGAVLKTTVNGVLNRLRLGDALKAVAERPA